MKKVAVIIIVCLSLLFTLCACNGVSNSDEIKLTDSMTADDVFDMISEANSFSIEVGSNDYRFIKGVGYSIKEEVVKEEETQKNYELFSVDQNILYQIVNNQEDGFKVSKRDVKEADYKKITDTYKEYVEYARGSYASTKEGTEVSVTIENNEAIIKTIYKQKEGTLEINICRLYDINSSSLYVPKAYSNYKEIAKDEEMS